MNNSKARSGPRTLIAMLAALALSTMLVGTALAVHDEQGLSDHCDDHNGHAGKVEASGNPAQAEKTITVDGVEVTVTIDGDTVTFTDEDGELIDVVFCMKAGDLAGGTQQGSAGTVSWLNHGGNVPDISYVIVYALVVEEPTEVTPLAPSVTPPTCEAAGTLVIPTVEGVQYDVDPAYAAGDAGDFTVTATALDGYVLAEGDWEWNLTVLAQLPDEHPDCVEAVVTGPTPTPDEGVLGGTPTPAPAGGQLPDTAIGGMNQVPATVLSLILLASLATMVYLRLARQR